jgi:hypothetical protein
VSRELQLLPPDGEAYLSPAEFLARLRAEFQYVETDRELGRAMLEESIARWERIDGRVLELGPDARGTGLARKVALLERLREALPHACYVRFGDDPDHAEGHQLVPPDGVLIVVEGKWQATLADRCARALGYVVHDI